MTASVSVNDIAILVGIEKSSSPEFELFFKLFMHCVIFWDFQFSSLSSWLNLFLNILVILDDTANGIEIHIFLIISSVWK